MGASRSDEPTIPDTLLRLRDLSSPDASRVQFQVPVDSLSCIMFVYYISKVNKNDQINQMFDNIKSR